MTLSKTSISLDVTTPSDTFTINGDYDGIVTVTSSDTNVATASLSGNVVTVTGVQNGSATITVNATGRNYTAASETCTATFFVNPLNTSTMTLGDKTVYFTAYSSIKWQVMHVDGNYVYLALAAMTEKTTFGSNTTYSGSTIASKCTTYLNNTIPNVADYLESVTVNGVTAKVFIPSHDQLNSEWDWPKAGASKRICQYNGSNTAWWTSSPYDSDNVRSVSFDGYFGLYSPSSSFGFRPAVKVQYKA